MTARSRTMQEATRLTRAGRLGEAMAVLRGTLVAPACQGDAPAQASSMGKDGVVDMVPPSAETGESWTSPRRDDAAAGTAGRPQPLGAFRGLVGRASRRAIPFGHVGRSTRSKHAATPVADGTRFEDLVYADQGGSRPYKLFTPSRHGHRLPLVVMLHGCAQTPDDFAVGTRMNELAEEQGFYVAYPAQIRSANASGCWNWFNAGDQRRSHGEPALIAGVTRQVMRDHPIDPRRVYVAGLSAGGAAAAILGVTYPDLYAAIGVHSGLACGAASDVASAFAAMRQGSSPAAGAGRLRIAVPTIVFHGDRDTTVNPVNGDQVVAQTAAAAGSGTTIRRGTVPGGISYTCTARTDESGRPVSEHWVLHGAGHSWSGGSPAGSYTDPRGPDASREMLRFFSSTLS
ncbi:PHB depolymerase family esterase [Inquilinus sp. YAF38]|uniref:extracellular catalytic domain type 1 short-chain-length polyhydroxyalkanoate depolymerase n=1 Tax=Inquilinus sp. YAF38 TaxID=3233084 RepID=UPI003F8E56B0